MFGITCSRWASMTTDATGKMEGHGAYDEHCLVAKSDGRDAGQVFRALRGPMSGSIVDLTYTDTADLYDQPRPTWVAAALMEWRPTSG